MPLLMDALALDYEALTHFTPTVSQRKTLARSGVAMPDGSFYIRNESDLDNAISAVGRATPNAGESDVSRRNAVRRHIIQRAKDLRLSNKIPDTWNSDGSLKQSGMDEELIREIEDYLEHFGRKGMKWGEHIFALHLQKQLDRHERVANGQGSPFDHARVRAEMSVLDNVRHKGSAQSYSKRRVDELSGLKSRAKSGNLTAHDRLILARNLHPTDPLRTAHHDTMNMDEYLEHFGRKGMKWGEHRFGRDRGSSGSGGSGSSAPSKGDKKWEAKSQDFKNMASIHNKAVPKLNEDLNRINNDPRFRGKDFSVPSPTRRAYYNEVQKSMNQRYNEAASTMRNPSGNRQLRVDVKIFDNGEVENHLYPVDVKHTDEGAKFPIQVETNSKGYILSVSPMGAEDIIQHFGRKGMKWGEHRFGRDRGVSSSRHPVHPDATAASAHLAVARKHGTSALSNKDLLALNTRLNLETQYRSLSTKSTEAGRSEVSKMLSDIGKQTVRSLASQAAAQGAKFVTKRLTELYAK